MTVAPWMPVHDGWRRPPAGTGPYTKETALLAGKLDGKQQSRGVVIPFADLLIGATALPLGYLVLTVHARHFGRIPGLAAVKL
jgi:predicted nucleic acid-binding protein